MASRTNTRIQGGHNAKTIGIDHTLRRFAMAMAGPGEFDPHKD